MTTLTYPLSAGFKAHGTSEASAVAITPNVATIRDQVLRILMAESLTADEVGERIGQTAFTTRPRLSELRELGKIEATDERRKNASGHSAIVWKAKLNQQ